LRLVEGAAPDRSDLAGAAIILVGRKWDFL
jgi:drug/metabolite transporter superfamily protein YnfA